MKLFYKPGACSLASHITLRESGKDFTLDGVDLMKKRLENGDDSLLSTRRDKFRRCCWMTVHC
jgi:glutathione S-transferase